LIPVPHFQNDFTIAALNFGSAFKVSSSMWRLALNSGVLSFNLRTDATLTALAGSANMKLIDFSLDSAGNLNRIATGKLGVGGFQLAQATFNVSLRSRGVLRMTLPANRAANINLGFVTAKFSGFAESDGNSSDTGSSAFSASIPALASVVGTGSFTISESGFVRMFAGKITVGPAAVTFSGTISKSGVLTLTFLGVTYDFVPQSAVILNSSVLIARLPLGQSTYITEAASHHKADPAVWIEEVAVNHRLCRAGDALRATTPAYLVWGLAARAADGAGAAQARDVAADAVSTALWPHTAVGVTSSAGETG
jgi:hypothetical protein